MKQQHKHVILIAPAVFFFFSAAGRTILCPSFFSCCVGRILAAFFTKASRRVLPSSVSACLFACLTNLWPAVLRRLLQRVNQLPLFFLYRRSSLHLGYSLPSHLLLFLLSYVDSTREPYRDVKSREATVIRLCGCLRFLIGAK